MFEAPMGGLILRQFDMECRGGLTTYSDSGRGGDGGVVTLTANGGRHQRHVPERFGGDTTRDETGIGGTGGTAQIAGVAPSTSTRTSPSTRKAARPDYLPGRGHGRQYQAHQY